MLNLPALAAATLAVAAIVAAADWAAVAARRRAMSYATKPLVVLLLLAVAAQLHPQPPAMRAWFVAALACSLVGDVLLMLPRVRLTEGMVAFLAAHLCYVAGFALGGLSAPWVGVGGALAAGLLGLVGWRLLRAAATHAPALRLPLAAYLGVLGLLVVAAVGSTRPPAPVGVGLFLLSDGLIARRRLFGTPPWVDVVIRATYHLAQGALVLSLAAG